MLKGDRISYLKNITISIFLIYIIFFLFQKNFINKYLVGGSTRLFGDWQGAIEWLKCKYIGTNLYAVCKDVEFAYGKFFSLLPFNDNLEIFYLKYLPYIAIVLLVFILTFLINPKKKIEFIVLFLAILNPSTLLLLERMNMDIFIFFILIFISVNKIYFFNWFLFCASFLIKLYPIFFGIILFIENHKRNLISYFTILLLILVFVSYFLFIDYKDYTSLKMYSVASKASYFLIFSLTAIPKLAKQVLEFNYIISILLVFIIFLSITFKFLKIFTRQNILKEIDIYSTEGKMFILAGNTMLLCYLIYTNYYYREIFLIALFPLFLKLYYHQKIKFIGFFIYFLILRYFFLFYYGYLHTQDIVYHVDGIRNFTYNFLFTTFFKGILDLFLMSFICSIILLLNKVIINNLTLLIKNNFNKS